MKAPGSSTVTKSSIALRSGLILKRSTTCSRSVCGVRKLSAKSFVDNFRTPHTEKLHVTERLRLVQGGTKLAIHVTAEDPDTFVQPWQGTRLYSLNTGGRAEAEDGHVGMAEIICQEGNRVAIDYGTPIAAKPDF